MWRGRLTYSLLLLIAACTLVVSGCAADSATGKDGSCVLNSDCATGEICASDQTCVPVSGDTCEHDSDCTNVPQPNCIGDQLTTYGGICSATSEVPTCDYVAVDSQTCNAGCSNGACNPDLCKDVVCDTPPDAICQDATTLKTYESNGTCAQGDCSYTSSEQSCVYGCMDGACNQGPCDQQACNTPPAPDCDGNTGRVYADSGQCVEDNGSATCQYDVTFNDCDYVAGTCDASTGTCSGGVTEVGGAVIDEIMVNPDGLSDYDSEWFEVVNTSGADIDLTGWKIQSGSASGTDEEHALTSPPAFPDGARLVFANGSDPAGDGSVTPDYVYSDISLTNTSDWIKLVNANGDTVDYVFWEAGSVIAGKSRKLDPSAPMTAEGNNDFANWCPELDTQYGTAGNYGTIGDANTACNADPCSGFSCVKPADFCNSAGNAVQYTADTATCQVSRFHNPYCDFQPTEVQCTDSEYCLSGVCQAINGTLPSPGDVIFTEFMGDPDKTNDTDGEYIELYNTTDQDLTLFTLTVKDNETGSKANSFVIEDPNATIAAHSYAVLVANTDSTANGGISGGYALADSPLKNSPGASGLVISLVRRDGTVIDDAYYGTPATGASQQLSLDAYTGSATNIAQANDDATHFCAATLASTGYTSGDLGSPGADNETCPAP